MDKEKLDAIIDLHKAQPVGDGYIDIIVLRENCGPFITDLIKNSFKITNVSWWEWCLNNHKNQYGLGGPRSKYFDGWFAELPVGIDIVQYDMEIENDDMIKNIKSLITTKTIIYPNDILTYTLNTWLTPAFWIDVPEDWKNRNVIS